MLRQAALYYRLTKPGIIRGNVIHALAGVLLAASFPFDWSTALGVLIGTSLVIASACVANNVLDSEIDAKMSRTKKRASVTGEISTTQALVFASLLLVLGVVVLYAMTNLLVIAIGIIAYVSYVFIYGAVKRLTVHSTLIGAVPGALPAMAGYVAVTNSLDIGAWLLFLLIFIWQMPHFYAISLFRKQEYKAAEVPVLGVVAPYSVVKRYMLVYIVLYVLVVVAMIVANVVGLEGLILLAGALYWLYVYFTAGGNEVKWSRSIFGISLLLSLLLVITAGVNLFVS